MVNILPFRGLRFNSMKINDISKVIAPPYDIISPHQKQYLRQMHQYNIVHLTLPEENGVTDKYENAKRILAEWVDSGNLKFDESPCFYLFEEDFTEEGKQKSFTGLVGLLKVEEYGRGRVLRHEMTLSKPKEDRLNLLRSCRANFEFIYTIYNDHEEKITGILKQQKNKPPAIEADADYDSRLKFKFWQINDAGVISDITKFMDEKTLLIADGHHRYETSRLYREESLKNKNTGCSRSHSGFSDIICKDTPEDYVLALFVSSNQEDISIHPTHRVIKFSKMINPDDLLLRLEKYFDLQKIKPASAQIELAMKNAKAKGKKCFCFCPDSTQCYLAVLKIKLEQAYKDTDILKDAFDAEYEMLDVNILHKFVLSGIIPDNQPEEIKYLHTIDEVLELLDSVKTDSEFYAGFILNAPDINTVENLSLREKIMPQKSTYFYPKPCSGLVIYKFET